MADASIRVLCLGNDLVADDAIGCAVAAELRTSLPGIDVVDESASGLYLIDAVIGVRRLVVVDAVTTGGAAPGTIHVFGEDDIDVVPGTSPHYVGLFETLDLVRALGLAAPDEVILVGVEIADATTIGGAMTEAVRAALPDVVDLVAELVEVAAPS